MGLDRRAGDLDGKSHSSNVPAVSPDAIIPVWAEGDIGGGSIVPWQPSATARRLRCRKTGGPIPVTGQGENSALGDETPPGRRISLAVPVLNLALHSGFVAGGAQR